MTEPGKPRNPKVGKLRPSQVVTQHGPGAVVDLPELSVIVAGTDHWWVSGIDRVFEPRLEAFLHVRALYRPPQPEPGKFGGLPSFVFPEWLVCPQCRLLAPFRNFHFRSSGEFMCTRNDARHRGRPAAFPARFMVACAAGHLDDFPWKEWVHGTGGTCPGPLELIDTGSSGSASDLIVKCTRCAKDKPLGDAFQKDAITGCTGRRPWLSLSHYEAGCGQSVKTILRGASNAYFSVVSSALSIPPWSDPIQQDLAPYREALMRAKNLDHLRQGIEGEFFGVGDLLQRYTVEQLWKALRAEPEEEQDLKRPEYIAFLHPETRHETKAEFEISPSPAPDRYSTQFSSVVAASRIREVRALRGFTRIDSVPDLGERTDVSELEIRIAPLGLKDVDWLPGIDLRGEGIFLQLNAAVLSEWEGRETVERESSRLAAQFSEWRKSRSMDERPFPGMRYVLLHTLAHALIRQFALDCGYSSSALRERIYCKTGADAMAGLLIYTASTDSDGSLGGLVAQAAPDRLGPLLTGALHESAFCASDPLCGGGDIGAATNLNGAACHACLLLAETSCEFGNRLLDRATLVNTLGDRGMAFFGTT
ncbi:MAG TPA: DUF1998 domain-containing protein [Streptosporangiaceae bacterium]|nr:DUF1998 domain-containing protein [Streptosporangiaceae bacterium]